MFRNETQVALDDLQIALQDAAARYREEAALTHDPALAELLEDLAGQRERLADRLAVQQRQLGDLPSRADTERETLVELWDWLQAKLSRDEHRALLEKALGTEEHLDRLLDRALVRPAPDSSRTLLSEMQRQVELGRRRLRAAMGAKSL